MSAYFKHQYIIPNEYRADASVLCMRCARVIKSEKMRWMKKFNSHEMREVPDSAPHSDFRQMPIELDNNGRKEMAHLLVCSDCLSVGITPEDFPFILNQIVGGFEVSLRWSQYPEEAIVAMKKRWANKKILRRLEGSELVDAYKV